jgi:hypothetical protein
VLPQNSGFDSVPTDLAVELVAASAPTAAERAETKKGK